MITIWANRWTVNKITTEFNDHTRERDHPQLEDAWELLVVNEIPLINGELLVKASSRQLSDAFMRYYFRAMDKATGREIMVNS